VSAQPKRTTDLERARRERLIRFLAGPMTKAKADALELEEVREERLARYREMWPFLDGSR
jgi:hypothetical protein